VTESGRDSTEVSPTLTLSTGPLDAREVAAAAERRRLVGFKTSGAFADHNTDTPLDVSCISPVMLLRFYGFAVHQVVLPFRSVAGLSHLDGLSLEELVFQCSSVFQGFSYIYPQRKPLCSNRNVTSKTLPSARAREIHWNTGTLLIDKGLRLEHNWNMY
jgi:hypothetical protein